MNNPINWSDKRLRDLLETLCVSTKVNRKVRAREDVDDVRSDVLLRLASESGPTANQPLAVWEYYLRKTFASALNDLHRRHLVAKKRAANREVRVDVGVDGDSPDSAPGLEGLLPAGHTLPTGRYEKKEQLEQLEAAIDKLPQDQQQAIRLQLGGMALSQIAAAMGKTQDAVSGLLRRATRALIKGKLT